MPWPDLAALHLPLFDLLGSGLAVAVVLAAVAWNHLLARSAGAVDQRVRSPVATVTMLAFCALVAVVLRERVGRLEVPDPGRRVAMVLGLVLMLLGAAVNLLGRFKLSDNWADQVTLYQQQTLVRTGVFALVRHPLYASLVWMLVGASLLFRNLIALALVLALFVPAMVIRARQEERLLADRFPEYEAYRRRVGMLMPRWKGARHDDDGQAG